MRSLLRSTGLVAAILAVVAAGGQPAAQAPQPRERGVVVTAATADGAPATGLTERDFIVREDGLAREVVRVSPAGPPSHVWLLLDDSQAAEPAMQVLRGAAARFIKTLGALDPAPQIALMTFGDRPTRRAEFTSKPGTADQAVSRLFSVAGTGAYFMQAVREASADLRKRTTSNPVIVAFVAERGPEFSNDTRKTIAAGLEQAGASLWTVVLQASLDVSTPEARERAFVISDVTLASGGMSRNVLSPQALDPAFDAVAALLSSRYLVLYARPERMIPPKEFEITARRPDVRVWAARWLK
jgi:hypothetical protein